MVFLRYSLLALLKLFQWAPFLVTLDPLSSSIRCIDGDSKILERQNFLGPSPPANYHLAGFTSNNRSSHRPTLNHNFPPSSSALTYALLVSQHKHYFSNFVDSLVLLYSEQLIYFNSGFRSLLVLAALSLGLLCFYSITSIRLPPQRNIRLLAPSWRSTFHGVRRSLILATPRESSGIGESTDRIESVCATLNQEAYHNELGSLATQRGTLRVRKKHTLHDDLDSPEIQGTASDLHNTRFVLPHETGDDRSDTESTVNQELGSCHSLNFSPSLKLLSPTDFKLVAHNAKPSDSLTSPRLVHRVRNSPPLAEAVLHEKARTSNARRSARKRDGAPHDINLQTITSARPNHGGPLSVSSIQSSFSPMVPQKRSWYRRASDSSDLEESGDSSFEEGPFDSESSGDRFALGISMPLSKNKNKKHDVLHLPPSTSRRDGMLEHNSLCCTTGADTALPCHPIPTATQFDTHSRSASTPVPSSRSNSSNKFVVTEVERDDSPSSGSERKFDGPDSFWEAAVQERLRVTATFTTLEPLKPKGARTVPVDPPQTTTADGDRPNRRLSSASAAYSPPWTTVMQKTPCSYSSPQTLDSRETHDQRFDDDLVPKPGTPGLASNQAESQVHFPGLTLRSGAYAKYVPPQRRVPGELVYTVPQRMSPMLHRSERMKLGSSSPKLEKGSCASTLSPWSPFAQHSPTSEAIAWKRGALFLPNPPPDEFANIDEAGNEKSWYARANWKTLNPDDWLSGSVAEKHATGKCMVKDSEKGCQLNTRTLPQKHCHDLWKNGHQRCETFGT
ncbi:uncharacterized protein EDB91DRAFT_341743 [Suillus paluster]|uniref:uncharacterized protein n=1 Tax=Suillus paluster TaxID=48578 RepID=UPI001B884932|nr:uncharacterized protein EDB91DRAFT_341743 [Suillus paluster]KAG1740848.1 hypothetical protein EDB91DRAFT_341743 [Suillus paluster]